MYNLNQKDKIKYLRKVCRENDLLLKKSEYSLINGLTCYKIVNSNGDTLRDLLTVNSTFDEEMQTSFITQLSNK